MCCYHRWPSSSESAVLNVKRQSQFHLISAPWGAQSHLQLFIWELEIQTQILMVAQRAPLPLSHLPRPLVVYFISLLDYSKVHVEGDFVLFTLKTRRNILPSQSAELGKWIESLFGLRWGLVHMKNIVAACVNGFSVCLTSQEIWKYNDL